MGQGETVIQVDPLDLFLPPSRHEGADPGKYHRAVHLFGDSIEGMPPLQIMTTLDDRYVIFNGVTRATRAAVLRPGETVPAEITGRYPVYSKKLVPLSARLPT